MGGIAVSPAEGDGTGAGTGTWSTGGASSSFSGCVGVPWTLMRAAQGSGGWATSPALVLLGHWDLAQNCFPGGERPHVGQLWGWVRRSGEGSPICLGDRGSPPFPFAGAIRIAASGRLVPCVQWSWRTKLNSGGRTGRGHSGAMTATGWVAFLRPYHMSLLVCTCRGWDRSTGWLGLGSATVGAVGAGLLPSLR